MSQRNRQARVAMTWAGIGVAAAAGAALPFALGMDGMGGGFAIAFASGFFALASFIAASVFAARARVLGRLLAEEGLLAHWTYPEAERKQHAEKELTEEKRASWTLLAVIAGFSLLIGIGFLIADPDAGRYVLLVLVGVVAVLAGVAFFAPRARASRRRRAAPEAFVSREAAYVLGMLHTWRLLGARVEEAAFAPGRKPVLRVTYSAPVLYGRFLLARQSYTVSIPVPPGEEERALEAARAIAGEGL